jgi:hypothetical protein
MKGRHAFECEEPRVAHTVADQFVQMSAASVKPIHGIVGDSLNDLSPAPPPFRQCELRCVH